MEAYGAAWVGRASSSQENILGAMSEEQKKKEKEAKADGTMLYDDCEDNRREDIQGRMATEYPGSAVSSGQRDRTEDNLADLDHPYRRHPENGGELWQFVEWQLKQKKMQEEQAELLRKQEKDDKDQLTRANEAEFHDFEEDEAIEGDGEGTAGVRPMRLL